MVGKPLYKPEDIWFGAINGYKAVVAEESQLQRWLKMNGLLTNFKKISFDFLQRLLESDPKQRLTASGCCTHLFFKKYYQKYEVKMSRKMLNDTNKLQRQYANGKILKFPYYQSGLDNTLKLNGL